MPKALKWILAVAAVLIVLIAAAVVLAPVLIDLDRFKPQIQAQVEKATGRPFTLGGPIKPSLFPWVGVALFDLRLGNPAGFKADEFVRIDEFEVRVKLLPLLSRQVEVKRFIVKAPQVVLIKNSDGRNNWEGLGGSGASGTPPEKQPGAEDSSQAGGLPIQGLHVAQFAVASGQVTFIDDAVDARKQITDINLTMDDISLDAPVKLKFSAVADNYPVSLTGTIGPVGKDPGKTPIAVDLAARLIDEISVLVKGSVANAATTPALDLAVDIEPFSLRKVLEKLSLPMPIDPSDDQVLKNLQLAFALGGSLKSLSVKDGKMTLDDSNITFSARVKDIEKPDLAVQVAVDRMDLDRYLPPPEKKGQSPQKDERSADTAKSTDYTALRKLVFQGRVSVGQLKASNLDMRNIQVQVAAKNGVIRIEPLSVDLYDGRAAAAGTVNLQKQKPQSSFKLDVGNVQAGPMLKDYLQKELITGTLNAGVNVSFTGDQAQTIRRTLDGSGKLQFADGAIVGIDLAGMVRNVQAAFGLAETSGPKPRTDFTEFVLPFTIDNGLVTIKDSRLQSPLLRVQTLGTTDLVQEKLDLRVEPKFVGTIQGQGDNRQLAGIMVPVDIAGTFSNPKFQPDIGSIVQQIPEAKALQQDAQKELEKTQQKAKTEIEKKAQELFKGLPFGSNPLQTPKK